MPRGFDRELEQRWRNRFEEFSRSGLKVGEFCRRIGVREHAFFHWRRELARRDGQSPRVQVKERSSRQRKLRKHRAAVPAFVPVEVIEPPAPRFSPGVIEVVLQDGIVLRLPVGCDVSYVQRLIAALGAKSC